MMVIKRDGTKVPFDKTKIINAIKELTGIDLFRVIDLKNQKGE